MKKHQRIEAFVAALDLNAADELHPCYRAYFRCFNEGDYYEAHDVLEQLWLQCSRVDPDYAFYKGLIQLAGAFVHLRKQYEHPSHAKHGRRLYPASRLFALAERNLARSGPRHHGLDVTETRRLCAQQIAAIEQAPDAPQNPWSPTQMPELRLD